MEIQAPVLGNMNLLIEGHRHPKNCYQKQPQGGDPLRGQLPYIKVPSYKDNASQNQM